MSFIDTIVRYWNRFLDFYSNLKNMDLYMFWATIGLVLLIIVLIIRVIASSKKNKKQLQNTLKAKNKLDNDRYHAIKTVEPKKKSVPSPVVKNNISVSPVGIVRYNTDHNNVQKEPELKTNNVEATNSNSSGNISRAEIMRRRMTSSKPNEIRSLRSIQTSPVNISRPVVEIEPSIKKQAMDLPKTVNDRLRPITVKPVENIEVINEPVSANYSQTTLDNNIKDIAGMIEHDLEPKTINFTNFETEQEEQAIISYDELISKHAKEEPITDVPKKSPSYTRLETLNSSGTVNDLEHDALNFLDDLKKLKDNL